MFKKIAKVLCCIMLLVLFFGCKKFNEKGHMNTPGIALTFDDNFIDNWYSYLPLLDSMGVKATFYICKYNRFTASQKAKLTTLQNHGHEIAYHTVNHYNMEDYVYKAKHSITELIENEIEAGVKEMNRDGFYPTTFAYPYGAHNGLFDKTLSHYFKSVRCLNGTADFSKSLVATNSNKVLYGLDIDKSGSRSDADLKTLLNSAKNNNACAVLVIHTINTSSRLSVTLKRLKEVCEFVNNNNLNFYTVSEISN